MSAMNARPTSVDESVSAIVVSSLPPPYPFLALRASCSSPAAGFALQGRGQNGGRLGSGWRMVCSYGGRFWSLVVGQAPPYGFIWTSAVVSRALPPPHSSPGPMQNADAFCMGTRPLRFAAGEGAEWRAGFILPSRRRGLCRGRSVSGRVPVGCGGGCRRSGWR